MADYLYSKKIWVRFICLYLIGAIMFLITWTLSFYAFPEGILKGSSVASKLAGEGVAASILTEFARIFIVNLFMACILIMGNYLMKINNMPLGYIVPPIWFINYGMLLGSNSFTFGLPDRIGPSLVVFQRSGIYEMAAYTLIAVATYNISRYEIKKIFRTNPEKVEAKAALLPEQYFGIALAILILIGANYMEAARIFNR